MGSSSTTTHLVPAVQIAVTFQDILVVSPDSGGRVGRRGETWCSDAQPDSELVSSVSWTTGGGERDNNGREREQEGVCGH